MDREQLWQRIRYRKGRLLIQGQELEQSWPIVVLRREGDNLLVRCDSRPQVAGGTRVRLEIWGPDALTQVSGRLEGLMPRSHGGCILTICITHSDSLQRRANLRYDTRLLTTFIPKRVVKDGQPQGSFERFAIGHVTNIGLGGMQLETEYDMPVGVELYLQIEAPGGPLQATGRIVDKRQDEVGCYVYGIEMIRFDNLTAARLHRIVNRIEREQTRRRRSSRYVATTGLYRRSRYRRLHYRRRME